MVGKKQSPSHLGPADLPHVAYALRDVVGTVAYAALTGHALGVIEIVLETILLRYRP